MRSLLILFAMLATIHAASIKEAEDEEEAVIDEVPDGMEEPEVPILGQRAAAAIGSTDRVKEKEVLNKKHKYHGQPNHIRNPGAGGHSHHSHLGQDYPSMEGHHDHVSQSMRHSMDELYLDHPMTMPPGADYPMDFPGEDYPMDHPVGMDAAPQRAAAPWPRPHKCPKTCDLEAFRACSCMHPATYSKDGRGNCNVGASKLDLRPWCYVDESQGPPGKVCPDARRSNTRPGYWWSRVACITP